MKLNFHFFFNRVNLLLLYLFVSFNSSSLNAQSSAEIYKQIKKNEQSPRTQYLFTGLNDDSNYQKSLQKMELMNSMDVI